MAAVARGDRKETNMKIIEKVFNTLIYGLGALDVVCIVAFVLILIWEKIEEKKDEKAAESEKSDQNDRND